MEEPIEDRSVVKVAMKEPIEDRSVVKVAMEEPIEYRGVVKLLRSEGRFIQCGLNFKNPGPAWRGSFTKEETADAYVYEMDMPQGLTADRVRVEIRGGRALRAICEGHPTVREDLSRNKEMKVRKATASLTAADGVLTVSIPKRRGPRKWHKNTDLVFMYLKTVRVRVSASR